MIDISVRGNLGVLNPTVIADAILTAISLDLVEAIKHELGSADIYTLSPRYSRLKMEGKTRPRMNVFPGKAPDQPLILTGEMYNAVSSWREGFFTAHIGVDEYAGYGKDGFDYAQYWEQKTNYLEKGLENVDIDGIAEKYFEKAAQ